MSVISTSSALLSRLAANQGVTLGNDGQLRTQSGVSRIFQKICDAFNSLSKTGSKAIEERTFRLEAKMAEVLRGEKPAVQNLAAEPIAITKEDAQANHAAINKALLNVTVTKLVIKMVPTPEMRQAAANLVMRAVQNDAQVMSGDRETLLNTVKAKMADLVKHVNDLPLFFSYSYDNATFQKTGFADALKQKLGDLFLREGAKEDGFDPKTNLYNCFVKDANRDFFTINGESVNKRGPEAFQQALPNVNPTIAKFLSQACTQTGVLMAMTLTVEPENTPKEFPQAINANQCFNNGFKFVDRNNSVNMEVVGSKVHISIKNDKCLSSALNVDENDYINQFMNGKHGIVSGRHYEIKLTLDLNQDMTGKQVPEFSLSGNCSAIPTDKLPAR